MEKAIKFLGICLVISAIVISSMLFYFNKQDRYKIAGTRVFDMKKGEFVVEKSSTPLLKELPARTIAPTPAEDISKVVIAGSSFTNNYGHHIITCTVQNKDTVSHIIYVKAIYYDSKKSPISAKEENAGLINPGDIKSVTFTQNSNAVKIELYDLKVEKARLY